MSFKAFIEKRYPDFVLNQHQIEQAQAIKVLGILNLTPDSFSDADISLLDPQKALAKAQSLINSGVDIIDVGAESTRPGASTVSSEAEWQRLQGFLELYDLAVPLSLDSRNSQVISRALRTPCKIGLNANFEEKADLQKINPKLTYINDVSGLQSPEILKSLADFCGNASLKYIAMHSCGGVPPPKSSEIPDDYYKEQGGLEEHMKRFFAKTLSLMESYGLNTSNIILDPGLGFGKNLKHSLEIIEIMPRLKQEFGLEILLGPSRKSFLKLWKSNPQVSLKELDLYSLEYCLEVIEQVNYLRLH